MKRGKKGKSSLPFFIPVVAIFALLLFGYFSTLPDRSGTLTVDAINSYGGSTHALSVQATVDGITKDTPFNVTLTPGYYTVSFQNNSLFYPTPSKSVGVIGGETVYAVGVYRPIPTVVLVTQTGFNSTAITITRGITPVVWENRGNQSVQIVSDLFNQVMTPGSNYTRIFSSAGTYRVTLLGTAGAMTVAVE